MSRFSPGGVLLVLAAFLVVAAVGAGIYVVGSPSEERRRQADRQRVRDLQQIANAVDTFWTREVRLPSSLAEVQQAKLLTAEIKDPESGRPYDYRSLEGKVFEVCADFTGDAEDRDKAGFWSHGSGRTCFRPEAKVIRR